MGILEDAAKAWVLAREDYWTAYTSPLPDADIIDKHSALLESEDFLVRMVRALVINPDNHQDP